MAKPKKDVLTKPQLSDEGILLSYDGKTEKFLLTKVVSVEVGIELTLEDIEYLGRCADTMKPQKVQGAQKKPAEPLGVVVNVGSIAKK